MSPLLVHKCKTIKFDVVEEITTSGYIQINLKIYYGIVSNNTIILLNFPKRMVQTGMYPWKIQTSKQSIFVGYNTILLQKKHLSYARAHSQRNTKLYHNQPAEKKHKIKQIYFWKNYQNNYVNINNLNHQYGNLLVRCRNKRSLATRSKEIRLFLQAIT